MITPTDPVIALLRRAQLALPVTRLVTPDDISRQRRIVVDGLRSDAHSALWWSYPELDLDGAEEALLACRRTLNRQGHPLADLVHAELDSLQEALQAFANRTDEAVTAWSGEKFGYPSSETLDQAHTLLGTREPENPLDGASEQATLTSSDAASRLQAALDNYGLAEWTIRLDAEMAPRMSIRPLDRLIRVREDVRFTPIELARLVVHEIGSHVLRSANAQRQPQELAAISLGNSSPTEEGLAVWHEAQFGFASPRTARVYAARALAVDLAREHGVISIAQTLAPLIGDEMAVEIAVRVKRGLRDPQAPGGFSRDHGYLTGLAQVTEHLARYPKDHLPLMATKWPLEFLPRTKHLLGVGELVPPQLLPDRSRLAL